MENDNTIMETCEKALQLAINEIFYLAWTMTEVIKYSNQGE